MRETLPRNQEIGGLSNLSTAFLASRTMTVQSWLRAASFARGSPKM
jgi:hypothetical protein